MFWPLFRPLPPEAGFSGAGRRRLLRAAAIAGLALALSSCAVFPNWRSTQSYYPVSITWKDARWCVPLRLKLALRKVSRNFGPVTVHSTHRWPIENWLKGGKKRSYHLSCRAVDFAIRGDPQGVMNYLVALPEVGGYSRYPQGFYHIDTGPRRTW
jgi:hypothetical protein